MSVLLREKNIGIIAAVSLACIVFTMLLTVRYGACGEAALPKYSAAEQFRLGERIYREGILPSGEPLQAIIKGDISVAGTSFTCASCHLRSGLGSFEGGVVTPATNGASLFQPLNALRNKSIVDKKFFASILKRPAYTDATLAAALRGGVDPIGQVMNPVMPRYRLSDDDMALLISYLKTLSAEMSPGVSESTLRFATVVTEDVSAADAEAMLAPLKKFIDYKNNSIEIFKKSKRSALMAYQMQVSEELQNKKLSLSRWLLKGPPASWRSQLEEYNRSEPVFALLGGITNGDWQPIHEFSEQQRIPCLFPQTNFPVLSSTDWYTLYFSKGYYQEGEAAARYLQSRPELLNNAEVVQIVRDSREGQTLSAGFQETWRELGHPAPRTLMLKDGETVTVDVVQQFQQSGRAPLIMLWDGPQTNRALELLAGNPLKPAAVIVSSSYVGSNSWSIPEQARDFTLLTYLYRLPQDEKLQNIYFQPAPPKAGQSAYSDVILKRSDIAASIMTDVLMDLRDNYYRDNLLDAIGMLSDQRLPLYERLSFGPGQRYASKGCYIVQLAHGDKRELIRKSSWVIH